MKLRIYNNGTPVAISAQLGNDQFTSPKKRLSMQKHFLRSEHWYVLKGKCEIITEYNNIEKKQTLNELTNGYIIGQGVWHQAINLSTEPCHILEVQYGERCVEEDIERRS
jgi:mannose-6-phosphate isomerase-like protein (cupin superfamily)